jgi:hypothetical protein
MASPVQKKYEDAGELKEKIEEYFNTVNIKDQCGAGLCLFLGICRKTYYNYLKGSNGEEIAEAIEWAQTRLENKYALDLNWKPNPTGPIFALKQLGWRDSQEVEAKVSGFEIVTNVPRPKE